MIHIKDDIYFDDTKPLSGQGELFWEYFNGLKEAVVPVIIWDNHYNASKDLVHARAKTKSYEDTEAGKVLTLTYNYYHPIDYRAFLAEKGEPVLTVETI